MERPVKLMKHGNWYYVEGSYSQTISGDEAHNSELGSTVKEKVCRDPQ
jgi:hypothetical protein